MLKHLAKSLVLSIFAFLILVFSLTASFAQDKGLEEAKTYFDQGQALYLQGKYAEAGEQFQKAYDTKKFPAFLFNVAVCHEKNRDFSKALSFYEQYLREESLGQDRSAILKRIEAIRAHLNPPASQQAPAGASPSAAAAPVLPQVDTKGVVVIESKPEGAGIYLDDKKGGIFTRTPYTGSLPPGQHTIFLEMKKYKPESKSINVRNDRMTYLYFALSADDYLGWIEVKANRPSADIYFENKDAGAVGRTPYTGFLRPGKRKLIVEKPGYKPYVSELDIVAGKDHVINAELAKLTYGWLKITGRTTEGAKIKVNGRLIECNKYPCQTELAPGSYLVEIEKKNFKNYSEKVEIQETTETQLAVRLNPQPSRVQSYISFGFAAACLTGAIITGVMSNNRYDTLDDDRLAGRIFDNEDPRLSEGKIYAIVSNSLYGVSAIAGTLGIYYLLRNVGPDSYGETRQNKIAFTPIVGPQTAGLSGQWRF